MPNSLSCTPSTFYGVVGAPTISSGFNIYRNLSLHLSYGVLYCFCSNTRTPGEGFKQTAYAIGFRINDSTSEDEEVYAIIAASNFTLGGYFEYPLKLK